MNKKILKWIDKNISVDLKDKNVFVTGGNSGIGYSLCLELAYLKANIFMIVRNKDRGEEAIKKIKEEYSDVNITLLIMDLSSLESIRNAVEEIKNYDVYAFINNAGIYRMPKGVTKDNIELTMGTNFIGTLYLNDLLNDYLVTLDHKVKVVFTTSITSKMVKMNYDDFYSEKHYNPLKVYAKTKVCINNMYYSYLDEYKDSNILFSLVHPGGTYTPLIVKGYKNKVFGFFAKIFMKLVFHTPDKAALIDLYAINSDEGVKVGPRGIAELSGYPKDVKYKKNIDYNRSIIFGRLEIEERIR